MPPLARRLAAASAVLLTAAAAAPAADFDWSPYAEERTVSVLTTREDGELRETTVWLVVVDGQGYIRTGDTRWGADVERDPHVALRIDGVGEDLLFVVEFVEDDASRERVSRAFREKYGFTDALMGLFRGSRPRIMRLLPR